MALTSNLENTTSNAHRKSGDPRQPVAKEKKTIAKVMFFWDYDTQWGGDRSRRGGPKTWGHLEFENTERLLDLHAAYQVPACFAVVGSAALPGSRPYHDPAQVRRIDAAGHEVGSHSHRHEWLPGLTRQALRETLKSSKDALEQCIGAPVTSFVPPYNQPFDFPSRWAFSLSERREAGRDRTDLRRLCEVLHETGYQFCRVAYQPFHERIAERILGRRLDQPNHPERICGITCLRLNAPGGFAAPTDSFLDRCVERGGTAVVYGHPHSITLGNAQDLVWLKPFMQKLHSLKQQGLLEIILPRNLTSQS